MCQLEYFQKIYDQVDFPLYNAYKHPLLQVHLLLLHVCHLARHREIGDEESFLLIQ